MKKHNKSELSYSPIHLAFLIPCLLLVFFGCERKSPPEKAKPSAINLKETRLATIPGDYDKWGLITFSADGGQVSYVARKGGRYFYVVVSADGENKGPDYESISFFVRSPDGQRVAFGGETEGGKHLVVDNKELEGLYHEEVAPAAFSPNGRLVACEVGGLKEKQWFIFVSDGEKEVYRSQVYPDTFRPPFFSPDGRFLVYALGEKNGERTVFFLDTAVGKIIKQRVDTKPDNVKMVSFNADSSRVVYSAIKGGKHLLVLHDFALGEEREIELPHIPVKGLVLSPNGEKITYIASGFGSRTGYFLVESSWKSPAEGKERGPYQGVVPAVFSPDKTTFAYFAKKNDKWRTVVGGSEGPVYDRILGVPVFSHDGARIAYPARKDEKWVMVVSPADMPSEVKEGPAFDMVVTPVFSPDGSHIVYRAREGMKEEAERFIVIANPETGKAIKEGPINEEVWPPVWSPDGKSAAYGARQGRELWWRVETVE